MKNQEEINKRCLSLIGNIKSICWDVTIDIATAEQYGLQDYDFTEQDYRKLIKIHNNFIKIYSEIPDFENIVRGNKPI